MDENLTQKIKETMKKLKKGTPFLMTVTVFDKKKMPGKELDTYILTNNFPGVEFDGTKRTIAKLIDETKRKQAII